MHYIDPKLKKSMWRAEDDERMFEIIAEKGCHWKSVADDMPGRSYNLIKNRFFANIRKGLRKASKAVHMGKNTKIISEFKPNTLSDFFFKEITFEEGSSERLPFSSPVLVKDFILYFASLPHKKIVDQLTPVMRSMVMKCLQELHAMK